MAGNTLRAKQNRSVLFVGKNPKRKKTGKSNTNGYFGMDKRRVVRSWRENRDANIKTRWSDVCPSLEFAAVPNRGRHAGKSSSR